MNQEEHTNYVDTFALLFLIAFVGFTALLILAVRESHQHKNNYELAQKDIAKLERALKEHKQEIARLREEALADARDREELQSGIDLVKWQMDVVIKTCPGRARPPGRTVEP